MAKKDKAPGPPSTSTEKSKTKKGKGKAAAEPANTEVVEQLMSAVELDVPDKEPDQYTLTSYTSASFESLPPVVEEPKKKKKKKAQAVDSTAQRPADLEEWSSDEFFDAERVVEVVEEEQKRKKAKKKPKKKKEEEEEEPIPDFKKPKTWKSMNKQQRKDWLAAMTEEYLAEKEAEKQAYIAGAKARREEFERMKVETKARDIEEQLIRDDVLAATARMFKDFEKQQMDVENEKQMQEEWKQYLRCNGSPDPRVCTQLNTYLHVWRASPACDPDTLERRCGEVLPMFNLLEELASSRRFTIVQIENFKENRAALRAQLSEGMESAMYFLLRDVERRMTKESLRIATYGREFKALFLHAWVSVRMPIKKKRENEPQPEPLELDFPAPALRMRIRLPRGLDTSVVCVRAARVTVDLQSETARTFQAPKLPADFEWDLYTFTTKDHEATYKLNEEQQGIRDKFFKETKNRIKELENFIEANKFLKNKAELEELEKLNVAEAPEMPDPRVFVGEERARAFAAYLASCVHRLRPGSGEVDLRKYRVCAGVLRLDLLQQPPQPKLMRGEREVTVLTSPRNLTPVPYRVVYRAPPPPAPGVTRTPEEIEAEMRLVETQYEKLAMVHIDLSPEVLWFEPPVVCQWNGDKNLWTSAFINDLKYNEDKFTITFRTGVLWPIGLATLRYSNLPYQGWELKPDPRGKGVLLSVSGLCVSCTWQIRGSTVTLTALQHAATQALQQHIGKRYGVKQMIRIMREGSCDMFPEHDAHNHVEGSCPKEWCHELHLYHAMACLAQAYNFQFSRWNAAAGFGNIVLQIREAVDKKRQTNFQTLLATSLRCTLIDCTEVANEYTDTPIAGMEFYPDLMSMNARYGSADARRVARAVRVKLAETIFAMLREIKPCSFS